MSSGWCTTIGWDVGKGGWGMCSESCKYLKNKLTGRPEDYDKVYVL